MAYVRAQPQKSGKDSCSVETRNGMKWLAHERTHKHTHTITQTHTHIRKDLEKCGERARCAPAAAARQPCFERSAASARSGKALPSTKLRQLILSAVR